MRTATKEAPAHRTHAHSKPLIVSEWMTRAPHSVGKDQPLEVAHRLMREHGLRHLPVLEKGKLVGIVTQRDLYFLETIRGVDAERERVEEGMSSEVYAVGPETRIEEMVSEMAEHKYGCAVVMEGAKVAGIFTTTDALRLLAELVRQRR
jgi:acetoin utilization protein AcuB